MKRKKKDKQAKFYTIRWDSTSGDGFRVKHRMWRDQDRPDAFFHLETRLTDDPVTLNGGTLGYEIYPRKFFGGIWIAQKLEYKRASTWKAIGEAVRQLEFKEHFIAKDSPED